MTHKLHLYNTLTRTKELFIPIKNEQVGMYVCGPTVYDRPHIGNARSVVVYDILYRLLCHIYGANNVKYIRNITDVDDKINAKAKELGISISSVTSETEKFFHDDIAYLNCIAPNEEPRATENIDGMIDIIQKLLDKSHAYIINNHVYFDIISFAEYGELSGRKLDEMLAGSRIDIEESKRHPGDFVLWKPADGEDDPSSVFESPWGKGRPGWHIECSAMSHRFLGADFDIHGGGADLMFPHHTNEIAQSRCAFDDSKFARYWVHNGFLTVNGEKMSKSLGNFVTVNDLQNKGVRGEIIRYLFLSTHYRKPLDFNDKAIYDAGESLDYLYRAVGNIAVDNTKIDKKFVEYLLDDMNVSEALSYLHHKAKELHKTESNEERVALASLVKSAAQFLGLMQVEYDEWFESNIDDTVNKLIQERAIAKEQKDWSKADIIRQKLLEIGIKLEDNKDGTTTVTRR